MHIINTYYKQEHDGIKHYLNYEQGYKLAQKGLIGRFDLYIIHMSNVKPANLLYVLDRDAILWLFSSSPLVWS